MDWFKDCNPDWTKEEAFEVWEYNKLGDDYEEYGDEVYNREYELNQPQKGYSLQQPMSAE